MESALQERGLRLDARRIVQRAFSVDAGREAFRLLMSLPEPPTAIVCGAEPFAYGAIFESQEMGLRIPDDVSVTGWMLSALFSGKAVGLEVEESAIRQAMNYIDEMTDKTTWRTGYHELGSPPARDPEDAETWPQYKSESTTAAVMVVRMLNHEDPGKSSALKGGATLLERTLPIWDEAGGSIDFCYWYFATRAMWRMQGRFWKEWENKIFGALVDHQRTDPCLRGSWDPQVDPWGDWGGRVYSTAINALTLMEPWRETVLK